MGNAEGSFEASGVMGCRCRLWAMQRGHLKLVGLWGVKSYGV